MVNHVYNNAVSGNGYYIHFVVMDDHNNKSSLKVIKAESETDKQKARRLADSLEVETVILLTEGDTYDGVTQNVELVSTAGEESTVIWKSSNEASILINGNQGMVVRKVKNQEVTLTATVKVGDVVAEKTYTLVIKGTEPDAPQANVAAGTYNEAQNIALTAEEGATIYYTTDGSDPTTNSREYTTAIAINETTTLKAIAVDVEGNVSNVFMAEYIIVKEDGSVKSPFKIFTIEDLAQVGTGVDGWGMGEAYILMKDLNFNENSSYDNPNTTGVDWNKDGSTTETIKTQFKTSHGWKPIGTDVNSFVGSFDGNDCTIGNLYIDRPDENTIALFGCTKNAKIKDLGVIEVSVKGQHNVGGLVGSADSGEIQNSYATGVVNGQYYVGGLVGNVDSGEIQNSYAKGAVNGNTYVGGLVGNGKNNSTIQDSYATGAVNGDADNVGGLVGRASVGEIQNSYATGTVNGNSYVGGLVGNADAGTIKKSYATGAVNGNTNHIGGLVGGFVAGSTYPDAIQNSYATGAVNGYGYVGGLVGSFVGSTYADTIQNSYATGDVNGYASVGGFVGGAYSFNFQNNIVYNAKVTGSLNTAKIGTNFSSGTQTNNYANSIMQVTGSAPYKQIDSADISSMKDKNSEPLSSWNFTDIWEIKSGADRPTLQNVGDDDGDLPETPTEPRD
ncbi:chitobiase/beta-hexosaminidase C-terminal domain-containing protein [Lutibacter sp. B2]|nr:chitobiase/beta-hexosaminidase C-terminal domain-containing protein [Lutibacter sp. B2]